MIVGIGKTINIIIKPIKCSQFKKSRKSLLDGKPVRKNHRCLITKNLLTSKIRNSSMLRCYLSFHQSTSICLFFGETFIRTKLVLFYRQVIKQTLPHIQQQNCSTPHTTILNTNYQDFRTFFTLNTIHITYQQHIII